MFGLADVRSVIAATSGDLLSFFPHDWMKSYQKGVGVGKVIRQSVLVSLELDFTQATQSEDLGLDGVFRKRTERARRQRQRRSARRWSVGPGSGVRGIGWHKRWCQKIDRSRSNT